MLKYVERELALRPGSYLPKVTLILPCKGLDPDFAVNITKLLAQEYIDPATGKPKFEVIFAVSSENDPAYPVLKKQCESNDAVKTQLVVAGTCPYRAQK